MKRIKSREMLTKEKERRRKKLALRRDAVPVGKRLP